MRAFICAYKFSRRIPVTKFIKPTEMPAKPMNEPINQDSNKNVMDEMAKMANEFEGTKTMKLVDKVLDAYLKKGYTMDQLINIIQKGGIINDEIKKAFQNDAAKNVKILLLPLSFQFLFIFQKNMLKEKQKIMDLQYEQLKQENPELYQFINTHSGKQQENVERGAPKYSHDKKDKKYQEPPKNTQKKK